MLPLAFGEAGPPGPQRDAGGTRRRGWPRRLRPGRGLASLREAAAGYWQPPRPDHRTRQVVCGPGSKPLLFGLLLAIGGDVAVPKPSWVSYAAQAALLGARPHFVPTPPGEGGVPDPYLLARQSCGQARAAGREIRSVVVTLPDNPTGTLARAATMRRLCATAAELGLIIISDEIYRDLVHDPGQVVPSPAAIAPDRTVVTTALSKSLALGGWRIGVARLPGRKERHRAARPAARHRQRDLVHSIGADPAGGGSCLHRACSAHRRIAAGRRLHASVARAVAARFTAAGARVPSPQAAFYLYPDFGPCRDQLRRVHGVTTAAGLSALLLDRYAAGVLAGSAFGDDHARAAASGRHRPALREHRRRARSGADRRQTR